MFTWWGHGKDWKEDSVWNASPRVIRYVNHSRNEFEMTRIGDSMNISTWMCLWTPKKVNFTPSFGCLGSIRMKFNEEGFIVTSGTTSENWIPKNSKRGFFVLHLFIHSQEIFDKQISTHWYLNWSKDLTSLVSQNRTTLNLRKNLEL